jgi:flagellar hook-basal body complex protein FliE
MNIAPLGNVRLTGPTDSTETAGKDQSFGDILRSLVDGVNALQLEADKAAEQLAAGEMDVHEAMIAGEKAYLAMQLTIQVRNKILDAYQEIMRMQV